MPVTWISIEFCNGRWTEVPSVDCRITEVLPMIKTKTYRAKDEVVKPQGGQRYLTPFFKVDSCYYGY